MSFEIVFAESVLDQMRALSARDRTIVLEAIERQLGFEPTTETRNRKPRRANPVAPWELRVGRHRVFYQVVSFVAEEPSDIASESATSDPPRTGVVQVLAVGEKRGSVLRIAGEVIPS